MAVNNRSSRDNLFLIAKNIKENRSKCIAERTIGGQTNNYLVLQINYYKLK